MVLSMDRWVGKVAVVTGASTGIGAVIAEGLVKEGLKVVGIARRGDLVEEISKKLAGEKGKLYAVAADITKEEELLKAFEWITKNVGPIAVLVNNAGVHFRDTLVDGSTELWRKTFDLNVIALCVATREAIKIMRQNNIDGHIIHINSIAGHRVINLDRLDVYPATKFGVTALTETLRRELNALNSKIKISSISPGAVDTPILDNMRGTPLFEPIKDKLLKSEDVANSVVYVLSTPPHVQIQELTIEPVGEEL